MNLIIDIGNSLSKLSLFRDDNLTDLSKLKSNKPNLLIQTIKDKEEFKNADKVILSSVKNESDDLISFLSENFKYFLNFSSDTIIPIKNYYSTPKTLGKDRLAAVVAANNIYEDEDVLIFDAGTALTIDFINKNGEYFGGCISPGINMRFRSLNLFTEKLPELKIDDNFYSIFGSDTEKAIIAGVQNGIINEMKGYIYDYKKKYPNLKIVLTGGDTFFFEKRIKSEIFADPNLVLKGLNIILNYNV